MISPSIKVRKMKIVKSDQLLKVQLCFCNKTKVSMHLMLRELTESVRGKLAQ